MSDRPVKKKKGSVKFLIIAIIAIILMIVLSNSMFVLYEGESAIVQRFGQVVAVHMRDIPDSTRAHIDTLDEVSIHSGTGIRFKIPFIESVIKYPSKLILYDSPPREVLTRDRHRLYFDNTAQWRIDNPMLFYMAYNNIDSAKERIDDVLYSEMRVSVGQLDSYDIISNRSVSGNMLQSLAKAVSDSFVEQGITVMDIRIKRTDLPSETYESIYNRMNTERQRVAAENRAEGERTLLEVRSDTDRQVMLITSEAERDAERIRGEADSRAAQIYNDAYSNDPEFFEFYNLLDTYRLTVGNRSTMVVPLDSPFAKYLLGIPADPPPPPQEQEQEQDVPEAAIEDEQDEE